MNKSPDAELIEACVQGKSYAFRRVFELLSPKMMSICRRYASNADEAKDFMQEGFIKAFENIKKFKGESSLEAWVSRIMVNNAITQLRKKNRISTHIDIETLGEEEDVEDEMIDESITQMEVEKVFECMQMMPEGYRTTLNLFAVEQKSHKEIAAMLGITESTSRTQVLKARKYLKELLQKKAGK